MSDLPAFLAPVLEDVRPTLSCLQAQPAWLTIFGTLSLVAGVAPLVDCPPPARSSSSRRLAGDPLPSPSRRGTKGKGRARADRRPLYFAPGRRGYVGSVARPCDTARIDASSARLALELTTVSTYGRPFSVISRLTPLAARLLPVLHGQLLTHGEEPSQLLLQAERRCVAELIRVLVLAPYHLRSAHRRGRDDRGRALGDVSRHPGLGARPSANKSAGWIYPVEHGGASSRLSTRALRSPPC